jgi:two-component system cell cycle sensor histidine kinase/response regulator CckA
LVGPNVAAAFLLEAVLASLLLNRRAGFAVVGLVAATFGAAFWLHQGRWEQRTPGWEAAFDFSHGDVALRITLVTCALGYAAVYGISQLLQRLERAVAERDASLARLEEEHRGRVQALQELEQREAAFLRARELEVLGRLAGFVIHDFNNALLAIFGGTELARRARSERERDEALGIVQSAATQAASTAKQLRAFGPRSRAETKLLDAGHVARTAERLLRTLLPDTIELTVQAEPAPRIRADEGLLQSALMNLSLNAWDAMRDGGRLTIRVRGGDSGALGRCAVIEVQDCGTGMDEATAARMFAPFFTTKGPEGSGLGLASVRDTVEAAGGHVSVRSALGQGTCISLSWPAAESDEYTAVQVSHPPPAPLSGNVLVVDDDRAVRRTVATYLRRCGLTALEAETRDEALQLATRRVIDVVITDGVVPGASAASFVRELRHCSPGVRILLCSGAGSDPDLAARSLADAILPRPFELEVLLTRLQPLISERLEHAAPRAHEVA